MHAIVRQAAQFHATHDVSLAMTLAAPVVRNGTFDFHERDPVKAFAPIIDYLPVTAVANATGQPAISLPLAWAQNGTPIGLHFADLAGRHADRAPR